MRFLGSYQPSLKNRFWKREKELKHSPRGIHFLDLKAGKGHLNSLHVDFPARHFAEDSRYYYLRRSERTLVPSSYRSGLAFFVMVMVVSMLSLSILDSQSMAQTRKNFLSAQLLDGLEAVNVQNSSEETKDWDPSAFSEGLPQGQKTDFPSLFQAPEGNEYQNLQVLNRALRDGHQAFEQFLETWSSTADISLWERMKWMEGSAHQALQFWTQVLQKSQQLSWNLFPEEVQPQLEQALGTIADLSTFLHAYQSSYPQLLEHLALNEPQRVLVLIQDSHDLRPTGGALSAGIEILLENGAINAWRPFHVQEYDDLLRVDLQPPLNMLSLTDRWNLSTANAYADVPRSAAQVHWFWQREARSSLDTIVFVTTEALEQFFFASGIAEGLTFEKASQIENLSLQWTAHRLSGDREALKTLASVSLETVKMAFQDPETSLQAWPLLKTLLQEKQVVFFSSSPQLQKGFETAGLAGSLPELPHREDALFISSSSTNAFATDRWAQDAYSLHTSLSEQGSLKHWLKISRRNTWNSSYGNDLREKSGSASSQILQQMSSSPNESLYSVYVPKGSRLLHVDGILPSQVVTQSFAGYTIWSFPMKVLPQEAKEVALTYELPWTFNTQTVDNYRLRLIKQAGTEPASFEHHMKVPAELSFFQQLPEEPIRVLDRDYQIAVVAGRNP